MIFSPIAKALGAGGSLRNITRISLLNLGKYFALWPGRDATSLAYVYIVSRLDSECTSRVPCQYRSHDSGSQCFIMKEFE